VSQGEAGVLFTEEWNWYSAQSLPPVLVLVGKAFYTAKKMKYAKYHKDMQGN
jgi:hypothetical protein